MNSLALRIRRPSPIRLAIRHRRRSRRGRIVWAASLVAGQAAVIHRGFWAASAAVAGLAALAVTQTSLTRTFVVYMAGPLLAYVAVAFGFRAERLRAVEYELACPPSARQLTLARLTLVLGYQVAIGLCLSATLAAAGAEPVQNATLLWLAPLLLGVGATLALSFGMPFLRAATLVYAVWLSLLAIAARTGFDATIMSAAAIGVTAAVGLIAIAISIALVPRMVPAMLARREPF